MYVAAIWPFKPTIADTCVLYLHFAEFHFMKSCSRTSLSGSMICKCNKFRYEVRCSSTSYSMLWRPFSFSVPCNHAWLKEKQQLWTATISCVWQSYYVGNQLQFVRACGVTNNFVEYHPTSLASNPRKLLVLHDIGANTKEHVLIGTEKT